MLWGQREDKKERECSPEEGRTFPRAKNTLALFPLFQKKLSKREGRRRRKKAEKGRERERGESFSSFFFCASFSQRKCSLSFFLSLFLSLFSLSEQLFVCVFFARTLHEMNFWRRRFAKPSIIVLIFPRYKSKQQQQHAKRAFYSVNARNKNRDTRTI